MNNWKMKILYPPNSIFKKVSPFPPEYRYRFTETRNKLILRDYPITLYYRKDDKSIRWLGFIYAFLYWNKKGEKVLRLERPCSFIRREDLQEEIYNNLIYQCLKLSVEYGADLLEIDLYTKVGGEICFPSTLSFANSYNSTETAKYFVKTGFQKRHTKYVFALPNHEAPIKEGHNNNIKIYGFSSKEKRDYWSLWSKSSYSSERPLQDDLDWELNYGLKAANDPRFILFAWENKKIIGFIHWFPNFYKIEKEWKKKSSEWILNQSSKIKSGKIFKIAIDPDFDTKNLRVELCLQAKKTMHKCGLSITQIGNINANDRPMMEAIKDMGGKELHTIDLLVRRVPSRKSLNF